MSNVEHSNPEKIVGLPKDVIELLDGDHLEARLTEAMRLSTVDEDGFPHAAQISVGECIAINETVLLVALWPQSTTTKNLNRDGKMTLALVIDGCILEIRAHAALKCENQTDLNLSVFHVQIMHVSKHRSAYADVVSGLTFKLHDPEQVLERWREQIRMLKQLAAIQ